MGNSLLVVRDINQKNILEEGVGNKKKKNFGVWKGEGGGYNRVQLLCRGGAGLGPPREFFKKGTIL